ncbi:hypothetical protein [Leifsonia sp. Root227]|uniref:hypothetical protein n=1 Tax=Leifsonia sp. Root227 TaxID=1736496 RepID=UPI000B1AD3BD|nr:hypothetical protein [Leifsonia sp. Root227]
MATFKITTGTKSHIDVDANEYRIGDQFINFYDDRGAQVYTIGAQYVYSIRREDSK